jgi:hypothetical protein
MRGILTVGAAKSSSFLVTVPLTRFDRFVGHGLAPERVIVVLISRLAVGCDVVAYRPC